MFPVKVIGQAASTDLEINVADFSGKKSPWRIPEEVPVAFVYNRRNYAVMLATPQDIVDYVAGFSLTENIIDNVGDILGLDIAYTDRGVDLRIRIKEAFLERFDLRQRRRNMPGNAGCGVCGLENADAFFERLPRVSESPARVEEKSILKAIGELPVSQPINSRTHTVHAAAWASLDGSILHTREDVGRHNALDKLLGALALHEVDISKGFVLMSSRLSYELVEKAARRNVTVMAALSGPTNFALQKAKEANMTLYARAPSGIVELIK